MDATVENQSAGVLREVSHDLGNQFHRFYYMTSQLRDQLAEAPDTTSMLVEEIEGVITDIEKLVRRTFSWMRPVPLRPVDLAAGDLLESFVGRCRDHAVRSELGDGLASFPVSVDPTRIGELLDHIVEWTTEGLPLGASIDITGHCDEEAVEFRFQLATPLPRVEREGLAMAIASQLAQSHGGRLTAADDEAEGDGRPALTLRLPKMKSEAGR